MRRSFVAGDRAGRLQGFHFAHERIELTPQPCQILLLPEQLFMKPRNGFILQRGKTLQLDNTFFHAAECSRTQEAGGAVLQAFALKLYEG